MNARDRIILPLDVSTESEALSMVDRLREHVGVFKVGLELMHSVGPGIVQKLTILGVKVFLDTKLMDIPNTVAGAARAATKLKVSMFNLHTLGGTEMMKAAVQAAEETANNMRTARPLVLGVTILTSLDEGTLHKELRILGPLEEQVSHLAALAESVALDGVIASPREIRAIRAVVSDRMLIITPGVRPQWAASDDQKRVMTPGEAVLIGASHVVIGRPITQPPGNIGTPVDAARRISEEIEAALQNREI